MLNSLRWIMSVIAVSLLVAASLHAGLVIPGRFDQAAIYETGVAVIVVIGLGLTFIGPGWARWGAIAALVLAVGGAGIGLYLALRGLAPDTALDIAYHVGLIAVLLAGIAVAWRIPSTRSSS
jgi:hypothetical protein